MRRRLSPGARGAGCGSGGGGGGAGLGWTIAVCGGFGCSGGLQSATRFFSSPSIVDTSTAAPWPHSPSRGGLQHRSGSCWRAPARRPSRAARAPAPDLPASGRAAARRRPATAEGGRAARSVRAQESRCALLHGSAARATGIAARCGRAGVPGQRRVRCFLLVAPAHDRRPVAHQEDEGFRRPARGELQGAADHPDLVAIARAFQRLAKLSDTGKGCIHPGERGRAFGGSEVRDLADLARPGCVPVDCTAVLVKLRLGQQVG